MLTRWNSWLAAMAMLVGCRGASPGEPLDSPDAGGMVAADAAPDPRDVLRFSSLAAGAVVGGAQTTRVEASTAATVRRVELFLDTTLIATAELAPFDLTWTTTGFAEGTHALRARAHVGDSGTVDAELEIRIDNTPPSIGVLPTSVDEGASVDLPVTDNTAVARVEVTTAGQTLVAAAAPFRVTWRSPCGAATATVRAIDLAGWSTTRAATITTRCNEDLDRDGYRATRFGGDDCNDLDPDVHPDADDDGWAGDRNCDGIAGIDGDGDGVAAQRHGGGDCNDARADVHGPHIQWRRIALTADGNPVTWEPGRAAFARDEAVVDKLHAILQRGGRLEHLEFGLDGVMRARRILATGVSPAAPVVLAAHAGWLVTAYVAGDEVHLLRWGGSAWRDFRVAAGAVSPGMLAVGALNGRADLVFRQDAALRIAVRFADDGVLDYPLPATLLPGDGGAWIDAPRIRLLAWDDTSIAFGNHRRDQIRFTTLPRPAQFLGAVALPDGVEETVYALRLTSDGSQVDRLGVGTYTAHAETAVSAQRLVLPHLGATLLVPTTAGHIWAVRFGVGNAQRWHALTGLAGADAASLLAGVTEGPGVNDGRAAIVAVPGAAYIVDGTIAPATETPGDGLDSDCDGSDT
jgi:hypothetical protein